MCVAIVCCRSRESEQVSGAPIVVPDDLRRGGFGRITGSSSDRHGVALPVREGNEGIEMVDFRRAGPAASWESPHPTTSMMKRPGPGGTNAPLFSGGTPGSLGMNDPADIVLHTPQIRVRSLTCACDRGLT